MRHCRTSQMATRIFLLYMSRESAPESTYCYVVMAGDRGLAGGYNANLFKCRGSGHAEGRDYVVLPIGKKAVEYFRQRGH